MPILGTAFTASNSAPSVITIPGGMTTPHQIFIAIAGLASANVKVEYQQPGLFVWKQLGKANPAAFSSGLVIIDGPPSAVAYRLTFTGLPGDLPGNMWVSGADLPGGVFDGTRALTVQNYTEANVKNGVQYYLRATWPSADSIVAGASRRLWFKTGALPVIIKLRDFSYVAEEIRIRLYKGPTGVTGGTDLVIHNYNGISPVAAVGLAAKKNVAVTSDGVEFDGGDAEYLFGASTSALRSQAAIPQGRERIVAPNSEFIVLIDNLSTGGSAAARVQYFLDFYVGQPDLPL